MESQTWQTALSIITKKADFRAMREWLEEHASPVPSTDADVIAKYLRCVLISNSEWDGVPLRIVLPRPRLEPVNALEGLGRTLTPENAILSNSFATSPRKQLAYDVLGLLMMLAVCGFLLTAHFLRSHHALMSPVGYNGSDDPPPLRHDLLAHGGK